MLKLPKFQNLPARIRSIRFRSLFTRKRVFIGVGVIAAFLIITPVATYAYYARDINNRDRLMNHNSTGIELKDRNGKVFYQYGRMSSDSSIPLSQISPNIQHALIASEDKDFYTNNGISIRGMARAIYGDVVNADPTRYGGSTITQQLVKNKLLTSNKNFLRKYQELSMAVAVDRHYSKQDILDMYLNSVYFGEGAFGIADAAKIYFGTTPDKLTVAQSALLVGLLPAPNAYSPISGDKTMAIKEQKRVLGRMQDQNYITAAQKQSAESEQLAYAQATPDVTFDHGQHFATMVMDQLKQKYGDERITRSGFEVTTSLDLSAQEQAESIIKKRVATFESRGGNNAGLVAIDPKTGYVRALVGSVDWNNTNFGQVNMAITPRQPGSSFKPIYYSYALDKHLITAATVLQDVPKTFGDWTPHDVDLKYRGNVTVRQALAQSMNIPAAEVMQKVTPETAAQFAGQLGITTITQPQKYGLTLAVGTAEAKLYEMTEAYTTFANQGSQVPPVIITSIKDKYGAQVFNYKEPKAKKLLSPDAAFVLSSILSDNAARAPLYGTTLNFPGRQVAVKTGTTDDNVDAWTIGYTPSLTVGVWVGNNEHKPMVGLAGGSSAGLIWHDTMASLLASQPNEKFAPPSGVRQIAVCTSTTYNEYFIKGTEPSTDCNTRSQSSAPSAETKTENTSDTATPTPSSTPAAGSGTDPNTTTQSPTPTPTPSSSPTPTPTPTGGRGGDTSSPTPTPTQSSTPTSSP